MPLIRPLGFGTLNGSGQEAHTMTPQKVQLRDEDLSFIETACSELHYRSKSEYMRIAIEEKIRADKRRLRELERQKAMAGYASGFEVAFQEIEADDFEDR